MHLQPRQGAWLGALVTGEQNADTGWDEDGVNNIDPVGDLADRDGADDGLVWPTALTHCGSATIEFSVTYPAIGPELDYYLNAWFDWNRNGAWGQRVPCPGGVTVDEWAVQNLAVPYVASGTVTYTSPPFVAWNPPPEQPLWLRVTLSDQPVDHRDGSGPLEGHRLGETEDVYWTGGQPPLTATATATATATPTRPMTDTPTVTATPTLSEQETRTATPTRWPTLTSTPTRRPDAGQRVYMPLTARSSGQ
jgi:hypothetical protein